jgi:hypothetical protein
VVRVTPALVIAQPVHHVLVLRRAPRADIMHCIDTDYAQR